MESLSWPLNRPLLEAVLADRLSDRLVAELVWERLGYRQQSGGGGPWLAGPQTPEAWRDAFPEAPEVVASRPASVALTRSSPREHKQLLKEQLHFAGYRIGELYPRRTRRATVVSWLLAWLADQGDELPSAGPLPELRDPPENPVQGHPGDALVG